MLNYFVYLVVCGDSFVKENLNIVFFLETNHFFPFPFLILEKVAAVNKYDPPPEVVAAQDHLTHVVNSVVQPQRIFDRYLALLHGVGSGWQEVRRTSSFSLVLYFVSLHFL